MAKNRNTPALYEVFGRTPPPPSPPYRPVEVAPAPTQPRVHVESISPDTAAAPTGPASPRIIRLPIGYIYVALAVVVLLIVGSYFVGVSRGRQQGLDVADAGVERPPISDPTLELQGNSMAGSPDSGSSAREQSQRGVNPDPGTDTPPAGPGGRTLDRDTRRSGLNYIIVERFEPYEAWAVKEFLKRNSIDVLVLADNNNRSLLQVVTAQGFKGWQTDAAAQALDRKLEQLGRQWKAREGGSKDFSLRLPKLQK